MTSRTRKQIILGILVCAMVYIWWGNIQLLWLNQSTCAAWISPPTHQPTARTPHTSALEQFKVKVNPFQRWNVSPPPAAGPTNSPPTAEIPRLSERVLLVGILVESEHPQAVLRIGDTRSVVLGHKDTLQGWSLIGVGKDRAWFGHDSLQDTLYLYESND